MLESTDQGYNGACQLCLHSVYVSNLDVSGGWHCSDSWLARAIGERCRWIGRGKPGLGAQQTPWPNPDSDGVCHGQCQGLTEDRQLRGRLVLPLHLARGCKLLFGSPSGTTNASLSGLHTNTAYASKAYRDDICLTVVAMAPNFLTRSVRPSFLIVDGQAGSSDYKGQYRACTATPKNCMSNSMWGSWQLHWHRYYDRITDQRHDLYSAGGGGKFERHRYLVGESDRNPVYRKEIQSRPDRRRSLLYPLYQPHRFMALQHDVPQCRLELRLEKHTKI